MLHTSTFLSKVGNKIRKGNIPGSVESVEYATEGLGLYIGITWRTSKKKNHTTDVWSLSQTNSIRILKGGAQT